jgi:hypothetical protein
MHAETEASGRTAYTLIAGDPVAMKENANNLGHVADQLKRIESGASEIISPMTSVDTLLKALVLNTEKLTGLRFDKLTGGTKELNAAMYQLQLEAARTYEKMDVIQKANFEEAMKKAKWPDDVIKSIEKGADAFKKAHDEAEAFKASAPGQALDEFDAAVERSQKQLEDWGQALKIWFVKEVLEIKAMPQAISEAAIAMANSVMDNFINPLVDAFNRFVQTIENAFTSVSETITNAFNAIWGPIQSVLDQIGSAIDYLVGKAQALMSAIGGLLGGGGGGEVQGHAAGGVVGGAPGVDQNLALLSRGEFVLKVAAVQKYGLGFLHGLNTLQAPRFAAGGLNVGAIGHSAATSPRVLNLTIEGQSFAGMSVPENTAAALERFAVHSQIASTGRKQSWRR